MDTLLPPSGTGPGILVAHPWWGLNQTIRDYGAALAKQGFVVALPDLFGGDTTTSIDDAEKLIRKHWETAGSRLIAAFGEFAGHAGVTNGKALGAIGFSFGGFHLLESLDNKALPLGRLVTYYATHPVPEKHAPVLAHFAGADEFESDDDMAALGAALTKAGAPNASYSYPGTKHWFAEADRPEYDAAAAKLAFERTVEFLKG
jgi:carboxymethylenebutenolidase